MENLVLTSPEIGSYLEVLGLAAERPTLGALKRLVRAHLLRIPFETISKLYYLHRIGLRDVPPLGLYLEGIRRFGFGGTCYSNNLHFSRLLRALGYHAVLCGADMPSGEDVHAAIVVTIRAHDWLIDTGYAAPLLAPLALDLERVQEVRAGTDRWVLCPRNEQGHSRIEHWRGDDQVHGYTLKPGPVSARSFDRVVQESFRPEATFMNAVLAVRCLPRRTVTIHDLTVARATARSVRVVRLLDRAALASSIEREIGIPASITREAIATIPSLGDLDD